MSIYQTACFLGVWTVSEDLLLIVAPIMFLRCLHAFLALCTAASNNKPLPESLIRPSEMSLSTAMRIFCGSQPN